MQLFGHAKTQSLLQIDRCTTTQHKAALSRKRSFAAQYVYNTKAK
jgi:hypothetical protein